MRMRWRKEGTLFRNICGAKSEFIDAFENIKKKKMRNGLKSANAGRHNVSTTAALEAVTLLGQILRMDMRHVCKGISPQQSHFLRKMTKRSDNESGLPR